MTDADIKAAIKAIEIHHEHDWWIANMPDIGVATQAKTLPDLGIEIERIIVGHFATTAEYGIDPFLCKVSSSREDVESLTAQIAALTADRDAYRAMICDLLASAVPHPVEHPTMTTQWNRARKLLKDGP